MTDAAIETFEVTVRPEGSPAWRRIYRNAGGEFDVVTESASVIIEVRAEGYAKWVGAPTLRAGESRSLDVPLARGRLLSGNVFESASGNPIVGATVYSEGHLRKGTTLELLDGPSVLSDSKGDFKLRTDSDARCLAARASRFAPRVVCSNDGREWNIGLDAGSELLGRLVFRDGSAASGRAYLRVTERSAHTPSGFWDLWLRKVVERDGTAEEGRFRFSGIPAGTYYVWATSGDGLVEGQTVTVPGAASRMVRLLVKPLARVTGNVSGLRPRELARLTVHRAKGGGTTGRCRWAPSYWATGSSRYRASRTAGMYWRPTATKTGELPWILRFWTGKTWN